MSTSFEYALRRTLPPWSFEENLAELKEYVRRNRIDELIVKIDTEEFSHGHVSLEWAKKYQKNLFAVKYAMDEAGVKYSLNPWITTNHADRGRNDIAKIPGLVTMVGHDGVQCSSCACHAGEVWRKNLTDVWRLYAATEPRVIWVEDDIRAFNHYPVRYGCFCHEHMRRFRELIGREVGREELVAAILQPGAPHPWRKIYLDMQSAILTETVGLIARAVHEVSPRTHMGLMSSGARNHVVEGRNWPEFCQALADGVTLYSRPPMYNYSEMNLRELYEAQDSLKLTRLVTPGAVEQTEVDNGPWSSYSKSPAYTGVQLVISAALGCRGATLNFYDHLGSPMADEPEFGKLLKERKPFLNALAEVSRQDGSFRGIQLFHSDQSAYTREVDAEADYGALREDGDKAVLALEALGIPTTYTEQRVKVLAGQTIRNFDNEFLREVLAQGALIDLTAALILLERGLGDLIGVARINPVNPVIRYGDIISAEEFHDTDFGGANGCYMTALLPDYGKCHALLGNLSLAAGCRCVSSIVNVERERLMPGMTVFENRLGGRVAVCAWELESSVAINFFNGKRRQMWQSVIRYLSRGEPELLVRGGVYPWAIGKNLPDGSLLLGVMIFGLARWAEACFEFCSDSVISRIEVLGTDGAWRESRQWQCERIRKCNVLNVKEVIDFEHPLFVRVNW